MSKTEQLPVSDLSIDLYNFRTIPQQSELEAIHAMISISPDFFWGLMDSLLDDGYLPTENIIVVEGASGKNCVKEGNRRVASLKILLGLIDGTQFGLPQQIARRITNLSSTWIQQNSTVPCTIYGSSEEEVVDKIVTRTHGKGSKAGRDTWEAVARARHNRDKNGATEIALDLLERYLTHGKNFSQEQKTRWAGRYNLTVLEEAIKRISPRFGAPSSTELARQYPNIPSRKALDEIIYAIGTETLGFPEIRSRNDFALRFGVPLLNPVPEASATYSDGDGDGDIESNPPSGGNSASGSPLGRTPGNSTPSGSSAGGNTSSASDEVIFANNRTGGGRTQAAATTDQRSVKKALRALKIYGVNRAKLETVRKEILKLKLKDNPIAFCFLLRSMFEISAKIYCQDRADQKGAPATAKSDGSDRTLSDTLRDIVSHLTQNKADKQMVRLLHGPLTEIQRHDGILSLTSMNQLVHNASFTISSTDIPTLFSNVFPLLEEMNK